MSVFGRETPALGGSVIGCRDCVESPLSVPDKEKGNVFYFPVFRGLVVLFFLFFFFYYLSACGTDI